RRSPSARGRFCFRPCLPDSKKSSRHAARRCASTPTSRDTSSKDSPRNSRNTTSILRFADHLGFDPKSPASSLDTDMSTMLAPLYRLSNDSGCGGAGRCSIRYRRRDYELSNLRFLDEEEGMAHMPAPVRLFLPRIHVTEFLAGDVETQPT